MRFERSVLPATLNDVQPSNAAPRVRAVVSELGLGDHVIHPITLVVHSQWLSAVCGIA